MESNMLVSSMSSRSLLLARFQSAGGREVSADPSSKLSDSEGVAQQSETAQRVQEKVQAFAYRYGFKNEQIASTTSVHLFFPHANRLLSADGLKFSRDPVYYIPFGCEKPESRQVEVVLHPYKLLASDVNTLFMRWQRLQMNNLLTLEEYRRERKSVSEDTHIFIHSIGEPHLSVVLPIPPYDYSFSAY